MNRQDKPIQARSVHHIGDMYIHKKHKFVIRIIGRGEWVGNRLCEVVKGIVPEIVVQRAKMVRHGNGIASSDKLYMRYGEESLPTLMEYSTCALTSCFTKLKSGQVLFG